MTWRPNSIDVREVTRLLRATNFDLSVGVIRSPERRYSVRTSGSRIRSRSRPRTRVMIALERGYERLLAFNLRHRWLTPLIGLSVLASTIYPFNHIDKNFDSNESEVFVQMRYEFSEPLSLERKERAVTLVENLIVPHRDELNAEHVYSFWSDHFSLTRLYMKEGFANDDAMAETRRKLRGLLPELPGIGLEVQDQSGHG